MKATYFGTFDNNFCCCCSLVRFHFIETLQINRKLNISSVHTNPITTFCNKFKEDPFLGEENIKVFRLLKTIQKKTKGKKELNIIWRKKVP